MPQRTNIFSLFLTVPNCAIKCKVTGKRINRGAGYGLEIPARAIFLDRKKLCIAEKGVKKLLWKE